MIIQNHIKTTLSIFHCFAPPASAWAPLPWTPLRSLGRRGDRRSRRGARRRAEPWHLAFSHGILVRFFGEVMGSLCQRLHKTKHSKRYLELSRIMMNYVCRRLWIDLCVFWPSQHITTIVFILHPLGDSH